MLITKAPKGTQDLLPDKSGAWQYLEKCFRDTCANFGYREIRFPTFEHTELFLRGVGDTTDVVQKQMYTFNDKGGRSITLRPEGTSSVARSFLENGLFQLPMPLKMFYDTACFRYEKSQKGRLREFHQFGIEAFGAPGPGIDAEVLSLAITFLNSVGLKDISVNINSIGCPECRARYNEALKEFLLPVKDKLCETCQSRFDRNPLRILDCKSEVCQKLCEGAPRLLDYICDDCREHFEGFKAALDNLGIEYKIDDGIVRGLDYYTKTVFEIISGGFTVCGGGRYDGLVEEFGGDRTPAVGFGLGIERLILRLAEAGVELPGGEKIALYIAPMGDSAAARAAKIVYDLRRGGISAECDHMSRSLKAQMKYADKLGALYTVVLGDNELECGRARIKNMQSGEQTEAGLDALAEFIKGAVK